MIIDRLEISHVRNIVSARIELHDRINLLVGFNGAGKTSALEAVHLLIRGRSFRTTRVEAVIQNGEDGMTIAAQLRNERQVSTRLGYSRSRGGRIAVRRDGRSVRQISNVAALVPVQLFLPDLPELVFGSPAGRRQWLDWGAFHVKPDYARVLRGYLRSLRSRNSVLRGGDLRTLDAWTAQVAELGESVAEARREYFGGVHNHIRECLAALSPGLDVELGYFAGWREGSLAESLGRNVDRDVKSGATQAGPHRADVAIRCGEETASTVLSRGQGKAVATAMRMGQATELAKGGGRSLFLIDDLGAELDGGHSERLYALLEHMPCQIVATTTHGEAGEGLMRLGLGAMFHVEQGNFARAAAG